MFETMGDNHMDRRIRRSRKSINETILHLLTKKKFEDITVTEIVNKADINRSTFYAHYLDKEDLIETIMEETLASIQQQMYQLFKHEDHVEYYSSIYSNIIGIFEFIYEEQTVFTAMSNSNLRHIFQNGLYDTFVTFAEQQLVYHHEHHYPLDINLYIHFSMSALVGVIFRWISDGFPYTPKELTEQLTTFALHPPYKYTYKGDR